MKRKKRTTLDDVIKAMHRGSRDAEIEMYGHPLRISYIHKNKKKYNRLDYKKYDPREFE